MFYILNSSHFKKTPSIEMLWADFINRLTRLTSGEIKPSACQYRRQDRELLIFALLLSAGALGLLWL